MSYIVWVKSKLQLSGVETLVLDLVLTSRVSGHHLDTKTLKNQPSEHPNMFVSDFSNVNFKHMIAFFTTT